MAFQRLIPCNEPAEYRITLRNPFAFDLEIKDLALVYAKQCSAVVWS